jgi:hypothetical protein
MQTSELRAGQDRRGHRCQGLQCFRQCLIELTGRVAAGCISVAEGRSQVRDRAGYACRLRRSCPRRAGQAADTDAYDTAAGRRSLQEGVSVPGGWQMRRTRAESLAKSDQGGSVPAARWQRRKAACT